MYIGGTDGSGLHNLLWEIVGNVVDQHLARYATELHVDIWDDGWVRVRDDGPGIPVDAVPRTGRSVLETVFTTLHTGPTFDGHFPHVHIRRAMGVGLAAVSALSSE